MKIISEASTKITKTTIDAAWRRRALGSRLIVRDKDCRGLALIVNVTSMTWSYAYRPRGVDPLTGRRWPNSTVTIGNPATHSPDDARTEANRIKGQALAGVDPATERKARAAEEQRKRAATLQRLLDDYGKVLPRRAKMRGVGLPSSRYVADEIAQVRQAAADMNARDKPAADLSEADLRQLLSAVANRTATARARFGALSRFLDWCQDAGHIKVNPCNMVARARRPKTPQARSHYLNPSELARLWCAADDLGEQVWCDLVHFLIAVPCRRSEATNLDWSHLNLAASEWRQPDHMTKNRDPHRLHLHPLAVEVLKRRWQARAVAEVGCDADKVAHLLTKSPPSSGRVFPAPRSGGKIDTFTDIKDALIKATKPEDGSVLSGWTWHDFRRSFASALGEAGIPEAVADAILNHRQSATRGGVLGVYQRSSRWPEQMRAMKLWGELLCAALERSDVEVTMAPLSTT